MKIGTQAQQLEIAIKIAKLAHAGQYRWSGDDYITHCKAVAEAVDSDLEKTVAWLHDVVEDTAVSLVSLAKRGMSEHVIIAVAALTRGDRETYLAYILRVKKTETALAVKLADLQHNMRDLRSGSLRDKYIMAVHILEEKAMVNAQKMGSLWTVVR